MTVVPQPHELRAELARFSALDRKVCGGLATLMIANRERVSDREWLAENFTRLAVAAHGFDEGSAPDADIDAIRAYATERMDPLVDAAAKIFVSTARDLQEKGDPFGYDDACAIAWSYLGDVAPPPIS